MSTATWIAAGHFIAAFALVAVFVLFLKAPPRPQHAGHGAPEGRAPVPVEA